MCTHTAMSKDICDACINLLVLGDYGVGKTSFMERYAEGTFPPKRTNVDCKIKTLIIQEKRIRLHLWDTANQERNGNEAMCPKFLRGANGVLLLYSIESAKSFNSLPRWLTLLEEHCIDDLPIIFIGHKCDSDRRQVPTEVGEAFAQKQGGRFYEASALLNINVTESYNNLIGWIFSKRPSVFKSESYYLDVVQTKQCCCLK